MVVTDQERILQLQQRIRELRSQRNEAVRMRVYWFQQSKRGKVMAKCEICGEPMPEGEEMFRYHGFSGPCPGPPLTACEPVSFSRTLQRQLKHERDQRNFHDLP